MIKSTRDTLYSDDAHVYEVSVSFLEQIRSYCWDNRKFMDRDYTVIRPAFNGCIKSSNITSNKIVSFNTLFKVVLFLFNGINCQIDIAIILELKLDATLHPTEFDSKYFISVFVTL